MSRSTPADLAVAFRSLVRRRQQAIEAAEGAPVDALLVELDGHVAAAAALVGAEAEATAVAAAIAARPAKEWDGDTLTALGEHATAAGSALRRIAEAAPPPDR